MNNDSRWQLLYVKKLEVEIVEAFNLLRSGGVEPVLIKGWAAARNYPDPGSRFFTDVDLAVSEQDFAKAKQLLGSKAGERIGIDLHQELRHLDNKPWNKIFKDSQEVDLAGTRIRIPSDEDHLRILAVHWLTDGGANKARLWDIFYAVQNRPSGFDWDRCLNSVSEVRQQWIIATIGLAHKYLDLEIDDFPFADRAKELPTWLISALEKEWKSGVPLKSLHTCLNDPKEFFAQVKKRLPPNPIEATIEMEGSFDNKSRLKYQFGSILKRIRPSIKGIGVRLTHK
jgi:Uncharacterised nucleotidyltransferase